MAQIEDKKKENSMFTCPNDACGKFFSNPLKALNLQKGPNEPYDACPYCLTEINITDKTDQTSNEPEPLEAEPLEAEPLEAESLETETLDSEVPDEAEIEVEIEETEPSSDLTKSAEIPSGCTHHLGYLSEKASNDDIPEECMMCKDIVACMLKKMKT